MLLPSNTMTTEEFLKILEDMYTRDPNMPKPQPNKPDSKELLR